MFSINYSCKTSLFIAGALLSSASWYVSPANADASLDELKAKLEKAEKENIVLRTEKLERENIAMKLEKIEAENATLRNEVKVDKTPKASISAQKTASLPSITQEAKITVRREPNEASIPIPREQFAARKIINHALDNIAKDDLRREMTAAYKAPREEAPVIVKQWQGIYAGMNAGYATGDVFSTSSAWTNSNSTTNSSTLTFGRGEQVTNYNGPTVGGQIGYNYQSSYKVVFGIETDFQYADVRNSALSSPNQLYNYSVSPTYTNISSQYNRVGLDWYGSFRARLGYSIGSFMPFITAGFAYGQLSQSTLSSSLNSNSYYYSPTSNYTSLYGSAFNGSNTTLGAGWTAGAGGEFKVADGWSVKGEYLYTSLSNLNGGAGLSFSNNFSGNGYTSSSSATSGWIQTSSGPFGFHQARVGINYHTGWLGATTPMTAKY